MVFGRMGGRKNWEKVRRRQNQNVLPYVSPKEEDHRGHSQNRQIINCGTKKEDDKIETKGEGKDGALQLQKMIDHRKCGLSIQGYLSISTNLYIKTHY
jgi:hypothetical protein